MWITLFINLQNNISVQHVLAFSQNVSRFLWKCPLSKVKPKLLVLKILYNVDLIIEYQADNMCYVHNALDRENEIHQYEIFI